VNETPPTSPRVYDPAIFSSGLPVLGICYGMQLIARHYGGRVERGAVREDGQFTVTLSTDCDLFAGLDTRQEVLLTHGDSVVKVPPTCRVVGYSGDVIAALQHSEYPVFGVQFHPEVQLTSNGTQMMRNFLYKIAGCKGHYSMASRRQMCIDYIRRSVGEASVLSLVSGGVDSTVCTALLVSALGPERVVAVHIDNGFMRQGESAKVKESLEALGLRLNVYDAGQRFYSAQTVVSVVCELGIEEKVTAPLHSVTSPEEKRVIIGNTFMKVADEVISDLQLDADSVYLAQGTLRPDLIESASPLASTRAHVIKTHHNDTQLVRELRRKGRVIEPLSEFHKDEVRCLGMELGLPHSLVYRHPFPGPGLAIRVVCQMEAYVREDFATTNTVLYHLVTLGHRTEVTPGPVQQLIERATTANDRDFLSRLTEGVPLSATLLPIYSVGVQGDCRSYNYVAAVSADETAEVPWPVVMTLAKLIPRICHNINRVVWVFGSAVPGPVVAVTPTLLTRSVLATLREVDERAHSILLRHDAGTRVSQMPVVLIPIDFSYQPDLRPPHSSFKRSVVLRPFMTSDFMTGVPAVPGKDLPLEVLSEMVTGVLGVSGISRVLYDLTPKPPGTTEWE
jgi:GMP synthase (glutamine-hydrolysing)